MRKLLAGVALLAFTAGANAQAPYDLLLKGGHVIDAKNRIDAVMDVAIKDGHIARVARASRLATPPRRST